MPDVASIQIGRPQDLAAQPQETLGAQPWRTAFFKTPVSGPVTVGPLGIDGDGQADRENHGGLDKAVCVYAVAHFEFWQKYLSRPDFGAGGYGENLSVSGITEESVCIGDVYKIGTAVFEVSQPRQPCWKLARRWQCKTLTNETIVTGKTGWYLRVLQPGEITAGDTITLANGEDPNAPTASRITISEANAIFYSRHPDPDELQRLAHHPKLSASWRNDLLSR